MAYHYDNEEICDSLLEKKNARLTDMLCRLYKNCEMETMKLIDPDIQEWMKEHLEQEKKKHAVEIKKVETSLLRVEGDIQALQREQMALKDKYERLCKE